MKTSFKDILAGLDLTPEQKTAAAALLGDEKVLAKVDTELKGIQSEFSRTLDETRTAVAQAKADKDAYYGQMNQWKTQQEATLTSVQEQARKDREAAALLKARMESLASAGILAPEDLEGLPTGTPPNSTSTTTTQTTERDPNTGRYVTQEEGLQYIRLPAMIADLQAEHFALTGKPLTNAQEIVDLSLKAGGSKTIRQVWEEKYEIPKVREEIQTRNQADHDAKIRREERAAVMSEMANPTSRQPGTAFQSPVLVSAAAKMPTNTIPNVGSRAGVERALAAHAAGKYEGGVVHATA